MNKTTALFTLAAGCTLAAPLAFGAEFEDMARVLSVQPRTEQVNQPQQECWTDYESRPRDTRGVGGALIGGVTGGLLGSQVGRGNGRVAAAAVGAVAGAVVGDRVQNGGRAYADEPQPVQRCRTVDRWETRTSGYFVTYQYRGHTYTDVLAYDPGDRLPVRVSLTPR